jgi:hypothetical protein
MKTLVCMMLALAGCAKVYADEQRPEEAAARLSRDGGPRRDFVLLGSEKEELAWIDTPDAGVSVAPGKERAALEACVKILHDTMLKADPARRR